MTTRRDFLKLSLAATAATALPADVRAGSPKALRNGRHAGETISLPAWSHGDASSAPDAMLMFRGNPAHTFYGTGTLRDTLEVAWRFQTERWETTLHDKPHVWTGTGWTGQAAVYGGHVFFGSVDRHLYCLDAATGDLRWRYRAGRMFKGSLCLYRNRIYAVNVDDRVHCLDATTGARLWTLDTGRDCDSSPCVFEGRLYVAGESGYLRCADPETGEEHWKVNVGGTGRGTKPGSNGAESSVAIDGDQLFVGNYDGEFRCLSPKNGEQQWVFETGDDTDVSAVIGAERVYTAAEEASPHLFCLERETGRELWRFSNTRGWYSTPALVGDRLYIGGNDKRMYCLDAGTGAKRWEFEAPAAIWCSPAVVDGKVLFGSYGRFLHMLDAATGAELCRVDFGGRTHSAPVVVDGRVYVGSGSGYFYCLQ